MCAAGRRFLLHRVLLPVGGAQPDSQSLSTMIPFLGLRVVPAQLARVCSQVILSSRKVGGTLF